MPPKKPNHSKKKKEILKNIRERVEERMPEIEKKLINSNYFVEKSLEIEELEKAKTIFDIKNEKLENAIRILKEQLKTLYKEMYRQDINYKEKLAIIKEFEVKLEATKQFLFTLRKKQT